MIVESQERGDDGHDAWRAQHQELGTRLDHINGAVREALAAGADRTYAGQLLERAWVAMVLRDLHGRTTVLGRMWEQFMLGDLELAMRIVRSTRSSTEPDRDR